jgi:hypothetical protein
MLDTFFFHTADGGLDKLRHIDVTSEDDVPISVWDAYRAMRG